MRKKLAPPKARELRRQQVVRMTAMGHTRKEITAALQVGPAVVGHDLYKPKSQQELTDLRDKFRSFVMEQTSVGLIDGTLGVVRQAISDGDAKSLELSTRAAVNLDKLTASAAGETQKVDVSGHVNVDMRAILAQAFAPAHGVAPGPSIPSPGV